MTQAEKLTRLRRKKGLTQLELAERLNVSRQAVSRWEVGAAAPSTENLKCLGELYGVSMEFLLSGDGESAEQEQRPAEETGAANAASEAPEKVHDAASRSAVKKGGGWFILALVLLMATVLVIAAVHHNKSEPETIPYEELESEDGAVSIAGNFSIKW